MTREKIICSKCGKLRQHHGNGVCNWCYRRYFWKPKLVECPRCKRMLPHHSRGYCTSCYHFVFHLENTKAHNHKRYHNIDYETYKKKTKKCLICGFDKVMELHHLDENHKNNSKDNLIGLCPNHHKMLHNFKYKEEVLTQIQEALADDKSPLPCEETEALEIIETEAPTISSSPTIQLLALPINPRNFLA